MGQKVTTPLSLTLDHWSEVRERAGHQGFEVKKKKWITLCKTEWVMMDVGWPREGTFNLDIISQVENKVFVPGQHGHPEQGPYITMWRLLATDPPPWVRPFVHPPPPASKPPPDDLSPPSASPPEFSLSHVPPRQNSPDPSPPPPSSLHPDLPHLATPSAPPPSSSLYPVLPRPDPPKKPIPVLPPDPNSPLIDLLTNEPPPYPEDRGRAEVQPTETSADSPIAGRLRERRDGQVPASQAFPLREGPNGRQQYWPFSASDLYNWKQHNPPFSRDPVALTNLIESILVTHQPTWDDCQQLLQTLLTAEERQRVLLEAGKQVAGENGRPTQLPNVIDEAFPLTHPDWDFASPAGPLSDQSAMVQGATGSKSY